MRKKKYNNVKVEVDGIKFDSKEEAKYYNHLKELKEKGEVADFELQPTFVLQDAFIRFDGVKVQPIKYKADFRVIYPDGTEDIVDIKGMLTAEFKLKRKMFWKRYGIELVCLQYSIKHGNRWLKIEELEEIRKLNRK